MRQKYCKLFFVENVNFTKNINRHICGVKNLHDLPTTVKGKGFIFTKIKHHFF